MLENVPEIVFKDPPFHSFHPTLAKHFHPRSEPEVVGTAVDQSLLSTEPPGPHGHGAVSRETGFPPSLHRSTTARHAGKVTIR